MRENIFACVQFRTSMITHWYGHLKKKKKKVKLPRAYLCNKIKFTLLCTSYHQFDPNHMSK